MDAGARYDDARAGAQRGAERRRVAVRVEHGDVRRPFQQLDRVAAVQRTRERGVAGGVHRLHRLRDRDRRRRALAERPQPERDQHAAARRRRIRAELVPSKRQRHRLALDDRILRQILEREGAAASAHVVDDLPGETAGVEGPGPLPRETVERVRELRNREPLAFDVRAPVVAVHRVTLRRMAQEGIEDPVQIGLRRAEPEAFPGERGRRGDELRPLEPPPAPVSRLEAESQARHGELEQLGRRGRRPRNRDERVEHRGRGRLPLVHEHEPAAPGTGERALANPGHERRRDAGVHRAPAGTQDAGACLRGQRMAGCDRTVHLSFTFERNPGIERVRPCGQPQVPLLV